MMKKRKKMRITVYRPDIKDRQRWENSPHPYISFNEDGDSMSFYGFRLDGQLNLIDERSGVTASSTSF